MCLTKKQKKRRRPFYVGKTPAKESQEEGREDSLAACTMFACWPGRNARGGQNIYVWFTVEARRHTPSRGSRRQVNDDNQNKTRLILALPSPTTAPPRNDWPATTTKKKKDNKKETHTH